MTIKSVSTVIEVLRSGELEGMKIPIVYSYKSHGQKDLSYALFTEVGYDDIFQNPYIEEATLLMSNGILTKEGQDFLELAELVAIVVK